MSYSESQIYIFEAFLRPKRPMRKAYFYINSFFDLIKGNVRIEKNKLEAIFAVKTISIKT
jgi:hypothetical protein